MTQETITAMAITFAVFIFVVCVSILHKMWTIMAAMARDVDRLRVSEWDAAKKAERCEWRLEVAEERLERIRREFAEETDDE